METLLACSRLPLDYSRLKHPMLSLRLISTLWRQAINDMLKYADDKYLLVLASNVESWAAGMGSTEYWASPNNLQPNRAKTKITDIAFVDKNLRLQLQLPPQKVEISRTVSLNILGVCVTSNNLFSEHVCEIFKSRACTIYALRTSAVAWNVKLQSVHCSQVRTCCQTDVCIECLGRFYCCHWAVTHRLINNYLPT